MAETVVKSNIAQIFDLGIYHGFSDNNAEYAFRNNHKTYFSSKCHPTPQSSIICTRLTGKNTKSLKEEFAMKENARKGAIVP